MYSMSIGERTVSGFFLGDFELTNLAKIQL